MLVNFIAELVGYLAATLGSASNYVVITGCASIDKSDASCWSYCHCSAYDNPHCFWRLYFLSSAADVNCLTYDVSYNCHIYIPHTLSHLQQRGFWLHNLQYRLHH
jgi:hypothetical protein